MWIINFEISFEMWSNIVVLFFQSVSAFYSHLRTNRSIFSNQETQISPIVSPNQLFHRTAWLGSFYLYLVLFPYIYFFEILYSILTFAVQRKFFQPFFLIAYIIDCFLFSGHYQSNGQMCVGSAEYFICPRNCGRRYKYKFNLNKHLRYACGVPRQFKCDFCDRSFVVKAHRQVHMLNVHKIITWPFSSLPTFLFPSLFCTFSNFCFNYIFHMLQFKTISLQLGVIFG